MSSTGVLPLLFCFIIFQVRDGAASMSNETILFNSLLVDYDKSAAPSQVTGNTTLVEVGMYIIEVSINTDIRGGLSYSAFLRLKWSDPRLDYSKHSSEQKIKLPEDSWKRIWIPDVFVRNAKSTKFHDSITPNRLMFLNSNGTVFYVMKVSVVVSCRSSYEMYPFDMIDCPINYESFSHTAETVNFSAMQRTLDITNDALMPDFSLIHSDIKDCSQTYTSGTFPCLRMNLIFKRNASYFIFNICIPSILVVILSWISFWLGQDAKAARLITGFLSLTALTLLSLKEPNVTPRMSRANMLDIWLLACYSFVFYAILEFLLVIVLSRRKNGTSGLEYLKPSFDHTELGSSDEKPKATDEVNRTAVWIDWGSRILFPLAFLLFNILFWSLIAA